MKPIVADSPNHTLGIDIKGPITLRNGEKKQYGIAVDYFSKYTYIFPLSGFSAAEFWSKFEKNVLENISTPKLIIGDSATQFFSGEAKKYSDKYLFTFRASTAYRHQANGEVENKIKFVDKLMHSFISRGVCWRDSVRQVKSIINNEVVNDSTNFTPYEIAHGHKHMSPFDRQMELYLENMAKINAQAKVNIDKSKIQQEFYYNRGKSTRAFKEGDWVMVFDNHRKGYSSDMRRGPYKVDKVLADGNYLVHDHNLGKWAKYNVEKLKLYVPTLDSILPPLDQGDPDGVLLLQPLLPLFPPDERPPQQQQQERPLMPPVLDDDNNNNNMPELQQQQQQRQQRQPRRREDPPDQPRRSLRSKLELPGRDYDYMYRKDTYT